MRPSTTFPRWILIPLLLSAAALLLGIGVLFVTQKRAVAAAPDYRVARIGGLEYEAMQGRPLDPTSPVDRQIAEGLAARDRRPPRRTTLFGAFISVTNDSATTLPAAERIELRDERGRVYPSLALPASNPYAYEPRLVHPRTRVPRRGTPADDNLAATGLLVLFRIPTAQYDDGVLELVIHDPLRPRHSASLIV